MEKQEFKSSLITELGLDEIRYSCVWEDPQLLQSGLQVHSADRVLSIGSAGCNALHLLLQNPLSVTAIDLNPAQAALIRLKKLAIEKLVFADFMSLIGFGKNQNSWPLYMSLRKDLSEQDRFFFDQQPHLFERGLSSQGRLEQYFQMFREQALYQIWDRFFLKALLKAKTPDEQMDLIKDHNKLAELKLAVEKFFSVKGLTQGRSEAQMKYVTRQDAGPKLFEQFVQLLKRELISENFYLHFFLTGQPVKQRFMPAIYQEANYSRLQAQIHKLQIVEQDLETHLMDSPHQYSKFNLSDIFEYMSPQHTEKMFQVLHQHLPKGGRIAYWTLLVDRQAPPSLVDLQPLVHENFSADQLWFYDQFFVLEKSWLA